jgi:hypothetical protein
MTDLLVVSYSCFTAINRNIYRRFVEAGWSVELVIPEEAPFPAGKRKAQPAMPGDPPIHFLNVVGQNPRIYLFEGLLSLLEEKKPKLVLIDNDPVSRLAIQVGEWCKKKSVTAILYFSRKPVAGFA